ncbi:MAG TPA: hypothetical protein VHX87_06980 [Galbitalea sp.]|jgi:hypothetical protein|nr:hypothetical protein [Galbitalea sp.]
MAIEENYIEDISSQIRARVDPSKLPDDGLDQLFSSYALLALSKGIQVTNEDVHDAWSAWASQFDPENESLVPFDELSQETQSQDTIFRDAIREVAKTLSD